MGEGEGGGKVWPGDPEDRNGGRTEQWVEAAERGPTGQPQPTRQNRVLQRTQHG